MSELDARSNDMILATFFSIILDETGFEPTTLFCMFCPNYFEIAESIYIFIENP